MRLQADRVQLIIRLSVLFPLCIRQAFSLDIR